MYKMKMKKKNTLKGNQKKLDANKDGKISGNDFALLKNKKKQKATAWWCLEKLLVIGKH